MICHGNYGLEGDNHSRKRLVLVRPSWIETAGGAGKSQWGSFSDGLRRRDGLLSRHPYPTQHQRVMGAQHDRKPRPWLTVNAFAAILSVRRYVDMFTARVVLSGI